MTLPQGLAVCLYARISTHEGRQHTANQIDELRAYARRMHWNIARTFTEAESGAKADRPALKELLEAAARREFDAVIVTDLSRLSRQGPAATFAIIAKLKESGVQFWSMNEPHFRTADLAGNPSPAGELFLAIAAYIAQQERKTLQERVKAGMDNARRNGKTIGRPKAIADKEKIRAMSQAGQSIRSIAHALNVSKSTIERNLKA